MRIRTVLALATGMALGAGGVYLLDPEHGETRRRDAAERAREAAAAEARRRAAELRDQGVELVRAARSGYASQRETA